MKTKILLAALATALTATAHAQVKVEDAIKWRQSAYATMGWSMARIDSNLKGTYNKEEVLKAATVLQAIANSGMQKNKKGKIKTTNGEYSPIILTLRSIFILKKKTSIRFCISTDSSPNWRCEK